MTRTAVSQQAPAHQEASREGRIPVDWENVDIAVLYDIFYEQGTALSGTYVSLRRLARAAGDEEGAQFWTRQIRDLDHERRAVGVNDRTAMVEHMDRWERIRRQLDQAQRAASYPTAA